MTQTKSENKPEINFTNYSHIKVANNRLMVKPLNVDFNATESGLALSSKDEKAPVNIGVVIGIGEGFLITVDGKPQMIAPTYELGDVVVYSDMAGTDFPLIRDSFEFEPVKMVDVPSIFFVDGSLRHLYTLVGDTK